MSRLPPPPAFDDDDDLDYDDSAASFSDEESLFARDPYGRLIRVDRPTEADLNKRIKIRVDGSAFFEVPKAVPATDAQGNVRYHADGTTVVRPTTVYDAVRLGDANGLTPSMLGGGTQPPSRPVSLRSIVITTPSMVDIGTKQQTMSEFALQLGTNTQLEGNVRVPVLCHQDHVNPVAVCRVCAVQIVSTDPRDPTKKKEQRKLLPACQHRVEEGMEVHTMWSPEAKYRKSVRTSIQVLYELLAGDHTHAERDEALRHRETKYRNELLDLREALRTSWNAYPFDAQSPRDQADRDRLAGRVPARFPLKQVRDDLLVGWVDGLPDTVSMQGRRLSSSELHKIVTAPPFVVDHNNCILCDRCIRGCAEVKPFKVIGRSGKGHTTRIAFDLRSQPMAESSCRACGECMSVCPTGAITFQYRVMDASPERFREVLRSNATVIESNELLVNPLFARMSKAFLEWNRGAVRRRILKPGEVVAEEDEYGAQAFILEEGYLAICREGGVAPLTLPHTDVPEVAAGLKKLSPKLGPALWIQSAAPGDLLGEMSPLSHARRNASIVAVSEAKVIEIDRNVLFVLMRDPENRERLDRRYAQRVLSEFLPRLAEGPGLFGALNKDDIDRLMKFVGPSAQVVRANPGYVICKEGEVADAFYLVRLGFVGLSSAAGNWLRPPLKSGDCFGEVALLTRRLSADEPGFPKGFSRGIRNATCTALDHAEMVRVPGEAFEAFLDRVENVPVFTKLRRRCAEIYAGAGR